MKLLGYMVILFNFLWKFQTVFQSGHIPSEHQVPTITLKRRARAWTSEAGVPCLSLPHPSPPAATSLKVSCSLALLNDLLGNNISCDQKTFLKSLVISSVLTSVFLFGLKIQFHIFDKNATPNTAVQQKYNKSNTFKFF